MRKYLMLWAMTFVMALGLCACGTQAPPPAAEPEAPVPAASDPNLGKYTCTSVRMEDMDIGAEGQWIRLNPQGQAEIYLMSQPDQAAWSMNGTQFTLTMSGETLGTGTLEKGVLTLELMGAQCVFVKEGAQVPDPGAAPAPTQEEVPEEEADLPPDGYAYLYCYGDLYRVTYPTDQFRPSADGLTDLVGQGDHEGSQGWIARLPHRETVDQWITGLESKADSPDVKAYQAMPMTVAGRETQAVVYMDAQGWHSAVVVDFGRDKGTKDAPMEAACLTFSGPTWGHVWSETIHALALSLELTP